MYMKGSNILYLFNFDGTLCGRGINHSFLNGVKNCLKYPPYLNPTTYDIRWSILTERPKIEFPVIKTWCSIFGLSPEKIFCQPNIFNKFACDEEMFDWKYNMLVNFITQKDLQFSREITKVFYIDNDNPSINYMNGRLQSYEIICITVIDFITKKFNFLI